jgi:hypothetical protein
MTAADFLFAAHVAGVRIKVAGRDLLLEARRRPSSELIQDIARHKCEIVELISPSPDDWSADDWHWFYDDRLQLALSHGRSLTEAASDAFEACITEWQNQYPVHGRVGRCGHCNTPSGAHDLLLPFGTKETGHVWLHMSCWHAWNRERRRTAVAALMSIGLPVPRNYVAESDC